ncbi:MAG TPA: hypothetical protein VF780_07705, partial [Nitrosospira sp.]
MPVRLTAALLPKSLVRVFSKVIHLVRRHLLLLASSFALSGCAGTVEMVRELARDLSDIDVASVGELVGWQTVELSPEQMGQLAAIPGAR